MSEKRFEVGYDDESNPLYVYDNQNDNTYNIPRIVDLLNELEIKCRKLEEENEKLRNIHLSIDLTYSYGYSRYLADVRVVDDD